MYGYHMYGDPWREQRYSGDLAGGLGGSPGVVRKLGA